MGRLLISGSKSFNVNADMQQVLDYLEPLESEVARQPRWKLLAPVRLQTLVLRHVPPGLDGDALDTHTRAWSQAVNDSGEACLTPTLLDGRWAVRVSLGSTATERGHVEGLWRLMRSTAGE